MQNIMNFTSEDLEIFGAVVRSSMIDMMDDFRREQWPSDSALGNDSMFPLIPIIDTHIDITTSQDASIAFCFSPTSLPLVSTPVRATGYRSDPIRPHREKAFTNFTDDHYWLSGGAFHA